MDAFHHDDESLGWTFFDEGLVDTFVLISNIFYPENRLDFGRFRKRRPTACQVTYSGASSLVDSPAVQRWLTQTAFLPSSALRRFGGNDVTRLVSAPAGTFFQVVDYKVQQPEAQQAVAVGHWRRLETRKKIERTTKSFTGTCFLWGCEGCLWKSGNTGESEFILPRPFVS